MLNLLPGFLLTTIWCGSFMAAAAPFIFFTNASTWQKFAMVASAPPLFAFTFVTLAGLLSRFAQRGIVRGVFPREPLHPVYLLRRIYGACWTQVFYFKPLYAVILAVPVFKSYTYRLFGFKESGSFVVYPDTWVRDLPMLTIGKGSYLANRSTVGTNLCLSDGRILVDTVKFGEKVMLGHLAMVAPVKIGSHSEIGVGAAIGIRTSLGNNVKVAPRATIGHGCRLNDFCEIGQHANLGLKVVIGERVKVPEGCMIPNGASLLTQEDVERYVKSEVEMLFQKKSVLQEMLKHELEDAS